MKMSTDSLSAEDREVVVAGIENIVGARVTIEDGSVFERYPKEWVKSSQAQARALFQPFEVVEIEVPE